MPPEARPPGGWRPDLQRPQWIHVVGIGGSGMSSIATVLAAMGHRVTGSDLAESATTQRLRAAGIAVAVGHSAANGAGADVVTMSSAVGADNPEVAEARRLDRPVLRRAEILAAICATRPTIAVAGTHGKTTTSSMTFEILRAAGRAPSCIIGGDLHGIGGGAVWEPAGELLVVEADESDGSFLELPAVAAVVTNVDADHLEHYGGLGALRDAFVRFAAAAPTAVVGTDDAGSALVAAALHARRRSDTTFGSGPDADLRMRDLRPHRDGIDFDLVVDGRSAGPVNLGVRGRHNAANALAALAVTTRLGVPVEVARAAVADFRQVARRFEPRGERLGVRFVDDYGHLPTEVAAAVGTAREGDRGRVVVVFQPHRYSRTEALHAEFADAFVGADVLVLTGIYAAGEAPRPGIDGTSVRDAVVGAHPDATVHYVEQRADVAALVRRLVRPGDLVLSLGAGDITGLADELLAGPAWPGDGAAT